MKDYQRLVQRAAWHQIIGPYYEDGTPIDIAMKLGEVLGGFTPPPAFLE